MSNAYIETLVEWLLLLALVAVLPISAFRFRKVARINNKRGWLYFMLGLGAGFLSFVCALLVFVIGLYLLESAPDIYKGIIFWAGLAIEYIAMFLFLRSFKRRFPKIKQSNLTLDSEFIQNSRG